MGHYGTAKSNKIASEHLGQQLKFQTLTTPSVAKELLQELALTASGNAKRHSYLGRVWQFLTKLNIVLPMIQQSSSLVVTQMS